jgi:hypothetical protein
MTESAPGEHVGGEAASPGSGPAPEVLAALQAEISSLRARNAALESRIVELEAQVKASAGASFEASTPARSAPQPVFVSPPPPRTSPPTAPAIPPALPPTLPLNASAPATPRAGGPPSDSAVFDTERFIGRRVVPIVGAVAVIGAVGFLVHYAIDTGLWGRMPGELRFIFGLLVGVALLAGGEFVRRSAPGAAVGLDAAGVGAFLVTIAVGVYGLELFSPEMGAVLSGAAGLFGAAWSVRTRSATVGACALVGLLGAPVTFGLLREGVLLAGSLLTVGILSGIAMQLLADAASRRRFEVPRFMALGAALIGGAYLLDLVGMNPSVVAIGFMLLWFGAFVAGAVLLALRGYGARTSAAVLAIAGGGAFLVQMLTWGMTMTGDLRAWFPVLAGGGLAAAGLLLRSFAPAPPEPGEVVDPREEVDRSGIECARLAETALALGCTLFIGGFIHFAPDGGQSLATALLVLGLTVVAARSRSVVFDTLAVILGVLAGVATWWSALEALSSTRVPVTLPLGAEIGLKLSWGMLGAAAGACTLFAAASLRVRAPTDSIRAAFAAFAWCAPAALLSPDMVIGGLFAIPAVVAGFVPRARRAIVVATCALLPLGYLLWAIMLADVASLRGSRWGALEIGGWSLALLALASVTIVRHASLGRARTVLAPIGFGIASLATAGFAVGCGDAWGLAGVDLALVFVAASGLIAAVLVILLPVLARFEVGDAVAAGLAITLVAIWVAAITGLMQLLRPSGADPPSAGLALLALASIGAAAWAGKSGLARDARFGRFRSAGATLLAAALVPLGALLLAAVLPGGTRTGLGALAVAGWILLVGVGEIALGFARGWAALRWGGLIAFVFLALRLFFVDLAGAPTLVRVALLFATGLALVGVGIVYARLGRPDGDRDASGRIAP